ncbi:hypothetical protein U0070_013287, partial [Myodes glareolus]
SECEEAIRALRLDMGNFFWGSECYTRKTRITDAVYSASSNELIRAKTLHTTPTVCESHNALRLGRKKGIKLNKKTIKGNLKEIR